MPFGLCSAPPTFEKIMNSVLRRLKWSTYLCSLDHIVVFAPSFDEQLSRLMAVLICLKNTNLTLNHTKCRFVENELNVLGHLASSDGLKPNPGKLHDIMNFPTPRNAIDLQTFLCFAFYFGVSFQASRTSVIP